MSAQALHVICIGTELLLGETVNTNFAFLGSAVAEAGLLVTHEQCVPDTPAIVADALRRALREPGVVVTIGGLGPTADDLSKEVVAELAGVPMVLHESSYRRIAALYRQRKLQMLERSMRRQAEVPQGSEIIPNDWGSAPGVWLPVGESVIVMLPGPPREMRPMFTTYVLPRLVARLAPPEVRRAVTVFGVPESQVEHETLAVLERFPGIVPAYCIRSGSCLVRLSAPPAEADRLAAAAAAVREAFGGAALAGSVDIVADLAERLRQRGWRLMTAESCTGGGIGERFTQVAGVSDVFAGGIIAYANELKERLLDVPAATLAEHGAVSEATARAMVDGLCERYGVAVGIAVTGIAGPTGGTPEKPVGTVWIATRVAGRTVVSHQLFRTDRLGVRERTIHHALTQLRRQVLELSPTP